MTVELMRQWTCDNCGHTESHPATDPTPRHWIGVMFNTVAPIGSMDHDGWSHDVLCGTCWASVCDLLDDVAQDDPYPSVTDTTSGDDK